MDHHHYKVQYMNPMAPVVEPVNNWVEFSNQFNHHHYNNPTNMIMIQQEEIVPVKQEKKAVKKKCAIGQAVRNYYCNVCNAVFTNSSNLKSHSRIHSGEKPYACDMCPASFVQSSNLKAHKRTHTGERPFECNQCGKTFTRSSHLTGHKRTHTGEKPYKCSMCTKGFTTGSHMRAHEKLHASDNPFKCHICDQVFGKECTLKSHIDAHNGVTESYNCPECDDSFAKKHQLRKHILLNHPNTASVPRFKCKKCEKVFHKENFFKRHETLCEMSDGFGNASIIRASKSASLGFCDDLFSNEDESVEDSFVIGEAIDGTPTCRKQVHVAPRAPVRAHKRKKIPSLIRIFLRTNSTTSVNFDIDPSVNGEKVFKNDKEKCKIILQHDLLQKTKKPELPPVKDEVGVIIEQTFLEA